VDKDTDFHPIGGVRLEAFLKGTKRGANVVLEVEDQGVGIPEKTAQYLILLNI
jgi:signal transduction histidine kinase